jgi:hypothetical protein
MAESTSSPSFERIPNLKRPILVESYRPSCGLLVGASSDAYLLIRAELEHTCSERLKFIER